MITRSRSSNSGAVLVMVVVAALVILIMGAGMLGLGFQVRRQAVGVAAEISATLAADAGLALAVYQMEETLADPQWDGTTLPVAVNQALPNSDAVYHFTVVVEPAPYEGYSITAVGTQGSAVKIVHSRIKSKINLWTGITVNGSAILDSGSTLTTFPAGGTVTLQTNSTDTDAIFLDSGSEILGDVIIGSGGDISSAVSVSSNSSISGVIESASEPITFPAVTVPDLPYRGVLTAATTITESGKYDSITVGGSSVLIIEGDITLYVMSDTTLLSSSSKLLVTEGSSLNLYLGGDLTLGSSCSIESATNDPTKIRIYGTPNCDAITLNSTSVIYGSIYAPDADLLMRSNSELYGAFVGNSSVLDSGSTLYYYESIANSGIIGSSSGFVIDRWWEE